MAEAHSDSLDRTATRVPAWLPWLTWGLGAAFFCYGFFQRVAPSVMIDHLMRDLALGGAILGNLSAFYFYAYASLQIPVGLLLDRFGSRRMLTLGALLCTIGSLAFAFADSLALAYLGRLLIGAGAGFSFVGTLKLASGWFPPTRFAQLAGFLLMAGMIGGIGGQAPLAALVEGFGWRGTLAVAALVGGLLTLLIWTIVRDERPNGDVLAQGQHPSQTWRDLFGALGKVVTTRQNILCALVASSMSAPMLSFAGLWGVAWLMQTQGLGRPEAAFHTTILLLGWAIGSPLIGTLSDRLRMRRPPLVAGALISLAALAAIVYLPVGTGLTLKALLFVAGLGMSAMGVCFALVRETNPLHRTGAALGLVNGCGVGAGAVFQPLIGWLLDLGWTGEMVDGARVYPAEAYRFAFSALVIYLAIGLFLALALRESHARQIE